MFDQVASSRLVSMRLSSSLVSAITHFVVILVLAFITISTEPELVTNVFQVRQTDMLEEIDELRDEQLLPRIEDAGQTSETLATTQAVYSPEEIPTLDPAAVSDAEMAMTDVVIENPDFSQQTAPPGILTVIPKGGGTPFGDRNAIKGFVGTGTPKGANESAIVEALKWLAAHQNADGSWNFDHRRGACQGRCGNAGDLVDCKTGATALGLLPFLGAGQTHKEGKYQKNVEAGLYYLVSQMKVQQHNGLQTGDFSQGGGTMYSHGLAAIVLCEAYGLTQDRGLMQPAQLALNHIVHAQDPVGGGWRYQPRTPGDTSVVGWQLMALKSGHLAYLNVPKQTIAGASKFLDSVQSESGARYGYTGPGGGSATTAVGLLSRMYLGWKKDHPGIERGVEYLSSTGVSKNNLYYDYYAQQVQLHYGGKNWDDWNRQMEDWLVATQDTNAHQKGSWHINGDHGSTHGGRLYCTSLSTLILEARFRISPIYKTEAAEEDFPL